MNFASPLPSHCATCPAAKYASPPAPKKRKLSSSKLNAAGAPKRPLNAFMLYRQQTCKQMVEQTGIRKHSNISSIIAGAWHALSEEEKQPYITDSIEQKRQHKAQYPNYHFEPKKRGVRQKRATFGNTAEHKKRYAEIGRSTVTGANASDALRALEILDKSESCEKRRSRKATPAATAPDASVPAPSSPLSPEEWAESMVNPDFWESFLSPSESSSSESSAGPVTPPTSNMCLEPQKPSCSAHPQKSWTFPGWVEQGAAPPLDAMPWEPITVGSYDMNDWKYVSNPEAFGGYTYAHSQAGYSMQPSAGTSYVSSGGSMHAEPSCSTKASYANQYSPEAQIPVYNEHWVDGCWQSLYRHGGISMSATEPCIPLEHASLYEQLNASGYC